MQHLFVVYARGHGAKFVVPVGFVYEDYIGELDDAFFYALKLVARARYNDYQEAVHHRAHGGFALAYAYSLDEHDVVARRFTEHHRFAAFSRHAAERAAGGRRADEGVFLPGEVFHAGLIAEDAAFR